MKSIKVLIADDQQMVRDGIHKMLELDGEITVVGEASTGEEALVKAKQLGPDVILMDVRMPGMGGIEATRQLKKQQSPASIIILTVYEDKYLEQSVEAGAMGYLLKDISREELCRAVKIAHKGQSPLAPSVTRPLLSTLSSMLQTNRENMLSHRQLDILRHVSAGATNKFIAEKLYLSEATIKRETRAIFDKLGVVDRTQAVAAGYSRNLL